GESIRPGPAPAQPAPEQHGTDGEDGDPAEGCGEPRAVAAESGLPVELGAESGLEAIDVGRQRLPAQVNLPSCLGNCFAHSTSSFMAASVAFASRIARIRRRTPRAAQSAAPNSQTKPNPAQPTQASWRSAPNFTGNAANA